MNNKEKLYKITRIDFPNTVRDYHQNTFIATDMLIIQKIHKNGEMAEIGWIEIISKKDGKKYEIKESVCDITYDKIEEV